LGFLSGKKMNLKTFYKIYYRHRILKGSFFLKIYLFLTLLFKYLLNLFYFPKKVNLDDLSIKNNFLFNQNLNYLFEYFNSDKGERYFDQYVQPYKQKHDLILAHGYAKFYEEYFKKIRDKNLNIIEIGSFYGHASAALFFYFKNSNIFSADINPDMYIYNSKRIYNFFLNSSSKNSIQENFINKNLKFDIIIEDASHMLKDQIISLFMLFKTLNPGGYFIIEEIDFPEKREDMRMNQNPPDLKTILNKIILNEDFNSEYITFEEKNYFLKNFEKISFHIGNFNEFAVIKKK
tara:strand:- start:5690 stop:6562 length:873 start_codon:yes stop_codon:yes gene_type:complete